jgi:transposase InsO family protein
MASLGCANGLVLFNENSSAVCDECVLGKLSRLPFGLGHEKASTPGQRIHSDVFGPLQVAAPGGNRYFVTLKDDHSGWYVTRLLKSKSEAAMQDFKAHVKKQTGREVKIIRLENGGEYLNSNNLKDWLAENGVHHERSTPYMPQQNGVAERTNRTIMEAARSMLHGKKGTSTTLGCNSCLESNDHQQQRCNPI